METDMAGYFSHLLLKTTIHIKFKWEKTPSRGTKHVLVVMGVDCNDCSGWENSRGQMGNSLFPPLLLTYISPFYEFN